MDEAHNANKTEKTIYTKFGLKKQKRTLQRFRTTQEKY